MPAPPPPKSILPPPTTLPLPRILCLHGGGTNATIFHNQLRSFLSHPSLAPRYRFVFVDAPFYCAEGVGVYPVYADWGPYRRWFRWTNDHEPVETSVAHHELEYVLRRAMEGDEGTGEWVGVLGFSQGAKLACSMLYQQQLSGKGSPWNFRFGIIMAGRCPFAAMSMEGEELPWLQSAGGLPSQADLDSISERPDMRLMVPTVHVHGLKDEGLELHRRCVEEYCAPGTTVVVEWDGPHRVPIKKADVQSVVDAIVGVGDEYGA
jgi:predicted esterase